MIRDGIGAIPFHPRARRQAQAGRGRHHCRPFLPSPLIEKLGSEGFASKVERGAGADWLVYFWQETD